MYTREEFQDFREKEALRMKDDENLHADSRELFTKAHTYNWIHQNDWMGEPCLQLPQDLFAIQEIIFKTRPEFIIEAGVAWGGSLLMYSTLMHALGIKGKVIGIDTYMPQDLKKRLLSSKILHPYLELIEGSSTGDEVVQKVKSTVGNSKNVMVILDSNHTHDHVLRELEIYSEMVGIGNYIVCSSTILEDVPEQTHRQRPWGHGNNPKTALKEFLKNNDQFLQDERILNKLLLTCNPNGYLERIK